MYEKNGFQFLLLLFVSGINAQITLEECQRKTQENYPLVHQYGLVEKTKEYNLENAAKGYLPQFALSAKASYQSDVTELPVKIPGVELKRLPKDQYQVMLELQQKIWDGGGIRMQKKQTIAEADVEKEKLNVDMYSLNSRVNDLYFGILYWMSSCGRMLCCRMSWDGIIVRSPPMWKMELLIRLIWTL